jgi:uncharacterized protein (DUF1501 family)
MIDRRSLLARSAVLAAGALCPTLLHAATAATDKRFVFIIQRGAADGLHIVPPMGDPAFASLRGAFLIAPRRASTGRHLLAPPLAETDRRDV